MNIIKLSVLFALGFLATQAQASSEEVGGRSIGGACCPFSDEALKTDIQRLTGATHKLLDIKGATFTWKEDGRQDIGVIAQDVEKVYPQLVHEENGHLQVDYDKLVAPLIESVRELNARIGALESAQADQADRAASTAN